MCCTRGKAFQILSKKIKITLNDKSSSRIKILKSNLKRLKFEAKILNEDFINFKFNERFDVIILDAPCSSVGTIRKTQKFFSKIMNLTLEIYYIFKRKCY